jgi:hypothetical protein
MLANLPGGVGSAPVITAREANRIYREKMGLPALGRKPGSKGKEKMKSGSMVESVVIETNEGTSSGLIVGFPELQYNPTPMPEISIPAMGGGSTSRFVDKIGQAVQQFTGFFNPQIAQIAQSQQQAQAARENEQLEREIARMKAAGVPITPITGAVRAGDFTSQGTPYRAGDLVSRPITPQGTPAEEIDFVGMLSPTKPPRPAVLGAIRQAFVGGKNRISPDEPTENIFV